MCDTVDGSDPRPVEVGSENPTIYKVLYIPGGAGGDPFFQRTMIMGGRVRIHPTSCRISSINSILPVY